MFNFFRHLFVPHKSNNHRAKLIHHDSLLFFVALFLVGSFFVSTIRKNYPQVLGISADISNQTLLLLTNEERQSNGLQVLQLNDQLSNAAALKAQNMFAEDYWAHFSPSGKSPWDFIHEAGYNYTYAGENLARGFTTASDVVNAWMASPEHRQNMLSSNYQDVGFAVAEGRLPGDSDTILVVEEFGGRTLGAVAPVVSPSPAPTAGASAAQPIAQVTSLPKAEVIAKKSPVNYGSISQSPLINSVSLSKYASLFFLSLFLLVFGVDIIITEKRQTVRLSGHSFDHLLFLGVIVVIVILITSGLTL